MTEVDATAPDTRVPLRSRKRKVIRHVVTTVAVGAQMMILYAGCSFSVVMDEFGCARSDPGWEPHGTDPLHGLTGFVFGVTSFFVLGAGLTKRWLVLAVETVFMCWWAFYLSSHPNDSNWCHVS